MREIILDTETTGLDPKSGHRIVEVACLEIINKRPTGQHFHAYINPQRDVPHEAQRVHGLSTEFLKKHPIFEVVSQGILDFVGSSPLVIHNAPFDMKFLLAEYARLEIEAFKNHKIIDTLDMARKAYPRQSNNLDALCKRFNIDISGRTLHGALIDCELLADVYFELLGGSQRTFTFNEVKAKKADVKSVEHQRVFRAARPFELSAEDARMHQEMLGEIKNPLWERYKVAS